MLGVFRERDLSLRGATQTERPVTVPFVATGGTTYTPGNGCKYHVFTHPNSDNFTVASSSKDVEALIFAGGG